MRFLFTTFEGGGHVNPALLVARRLKGRGHSVLVVSDEANGAQARSAGLDFTPWHTAPNRAELGRAEDPLQDWRARWPPGIVRAICKAVICGPALAYARDALQAINDFHPDAVISNELLFGVMAAAELRGLPLGLLTANVWCFPTRMDVPPFGPGFAPSNRRLAIGRDLRTRSMIAGWYDAGLRDLNLARQALGLPVLGRVLDQLDAARLVMLGTSEAFDFGRRPPPPPFAYAGPLTGTMEWAEQPEAADGPAEGDDRPIVLVACSTAYQHQGPVLARCVQAVAELPVKAIVTLGPAMRRELLPAAANVDVLDQVPHDRILPHCAAVLSHGGHGTVLRALAFGVPVVCIAAGRDHADNAQRLAQRGAGIGLPGWAAAPTIRYALRQVLHDPLFRDRAQTLGAAIRREDDGGEGAAEMFEGMVAGDAASAFRQADRGR